MLAAVSFAGVDVGFVPTDSAAARAALAWAGVGPGDSVFELGCGDGRVAEADAGILAGPALKRHR